MHEEPRPAPALRTPFVGVSLKLYFGLAETRCWLAEVAALADHLSALPRPVDVAVLPSFPALAEARSLLAGSGITFGAQDVHWAGKGAWTGAVSASMLVEAGAHYAEIGHAERRLHFGEDDAAVAAKARAATRAGLTPVICVGEQHGEDLGRAVEETLVQVDSALRGAEPGSDVVIAYEPVWAIGADTPAPAPHVRAVVEAMGETLRAYDVQGRIIYGGTAGPGTFTELTDGGRWTGLDGLFLGRLAHDPANLRKILDEVAGFWPKATTAS
ncbi:triosephosphate isomerase [Streptomyces sp. 205]|uniref:Triosephosphate isomerase n=2 Tax=Streptomyces coffeae TaxID=621382 RepID=A0ABS1ND25_9ACTN|nr:triosephosphate isomerase [Streptomyces coffeae]